MESFTGDAVLIKMNNKNKFHLNRFLVLCSLILFLVTHPDPTHLHPQTCVEQLQEQQQNEPTLA